MALALAIAGVVSAISLPVGLFPQVAFPRVVVDLDAGSRPADQMALLVTRPVEEAIRTVPGVIDVRSASTRGTAQISVDFGWGRDMVSSTLLVDAAVSQILPNLPPGTGYNVRRMDPTVFPIISYALLSDSMSPVTLHDLAQYQIVPLLSSIPGLARVSVQGGETAEVEVLADPQRLASYGLAMTDLSDALTKANVLQAVGQLQDNHKLYLVTADHSIGKTEAVGDVVVRSDPAGVVRVRDVATVQDGVVPQWIRVVEDGKPAVLFNVYEQPDGNAVQIAGAVQAKLGAFKLPPGVRMVKWYDQSELVTQSAGSVRDAVLIGLVLAAIVLILFLRSWRVTLIAVLVVPATLATAILVLSLLGMSFNIMTLGGIAAAVGLLIDDVIVMVEHIARRAGRRGRGWNGRRCRGAAGQPRVPAPADRFQPGDADRVPAAGLPERRYRRVFAGAVDHHGRGAGDLLPDDRVCRARAGAASGRLRPLARPGRGGRRLAGAAAWTAAGRPVPPALAVRRSPWCRCWPLDGSPMAPCRRASCRRSMKAASSWTTTPRPAPR